MKWSHWCSGENEITGVRIPEELRIVNLVFLRSEGRGDLRREVFLKSYLFLKSELFLRSEEC